VLPTLGCISSALLWDNQNNILNPPSYIPMSSWSSIGASIIFFVIVLFFPLLFVSIMDIKLISN
jgi:hypothetical protein